jgi:integrase
MGRPLTGNVRVKDTARGRVYSLRFTDNGERQHETLPLGTTAEEAHEQLSYRLVDVARGIWRPPAPAPVIDLAADPTFHEFASDWFEDFKGEWRESTRLDYEWQLSHHLLPFFGAHKLSQITVAEVDRYRQHKAAEAETIRAAAAKGKPLREEFVDKLGRRRERERRALSATSINKTITRLGQVLELAVERELVTRNAAKVGGKRRKLKATRPTRAYLDGAEQIAALLDAAGRLDAASRSNGKIGRKAMLGTLVEGAALVATLDRTPVRIS